MSLDWFIFSFSQNRFFNTLAIFFFHSQFSGRKILCQSCFSEIPCKFVYAFYTVIATLTPFNSFASVIAFIYCKNLIYYKIHDPGLRVVFSVHLVLFLKTISEGI